MGTRESPPSCGNLSSLHHKRKAAPLSTITTCAALLVLATITNVNATNVDQVGLNAQCKDVGRQPFCHEQVWASASSFRAEGRAAENQTHSSVYAWYAPCLGTPIHYD